MQSSMSSSKEPESLSAGGFLPSPAASFASTASTVTPSTLPAQRARPLKPGMPKETLVINHMDKQILRINRRHAKKFSSAIGGLDEPAEDRGYESFKEVVKDLEVLIDIAWVSGTPSLQIPFLISLAGLTNNYLPDYPFSPAATFRLLRKLDIIFASLIVGEDVETGSPLSGFETRRDIVSMTEKVRIKSIAEMGRLAVIQATDREDEENDDEMDLDSTNGNGDGIDDDSDDSAEGVAVDRYPEGLGKWEMEAGRVYERTIDLLGGELGNCELVS